jgi:hypothetical protein
MPPLTPQITLNATLDSSVGGQSLGGWLRVTLCGYGPQLPAIPGTCMLADAGVPQLVGPQVGSTPITVQLWGNDVITPQNTFYEVAVLDQNKDVIQSGIYQFNGAGSFDLSQVAQFIPPYGFGIGYLSYLPCTGSGATWTAPGPIVGVAYNGIMLPMGAALPFLSWTPNGATGITLNFSAELGDQIDAFCIV